MTETSLADTYRKSLQYTKQAKDYLENKRCIDYDLISSKLGTIGFLPSVETLGTKIYDVLAIPVFDVLGRLSQLECRSLITKKYFKLRYNKTRVPLYMEFEKAFKNKETAQPMFMVEGAIEAMSILTSNPDALIISTLRASASKAQLHYLKYYTDNLVLVFNNDASGVKNAGRIVDYYENAYNYLVNIGEIPDEFKDLNQMLQEDKELFNVFVKNLITEYTPYK